MKINCICVYDIGVNVYAHKAVLNCRCDVMSAMIGGHFAEGRSEISQVCLSFDFTPMEFHPKCHAFMAQLFHEF
jgi:hypothetical protein